MVQNGRIQGQSAGLVLMENPTKLISAAEFLKRAESNGHVRNGDIQTPNVRDDDFLDGIDGIEIVEAVVTIEEARSENGVPNGMDAMDSHVIHDNNNDVTDSAPIASLISKFDDTSRYDMNHNERGCFLIFDMEVFDPHLGLDPRIGTRKDAQNMFHTAKHMGFEYIQTFHNPTKDDVFDWMRGVSKASHQGYDSFGCAILTHGDADDVLFARDRSFKLSQLTEMFTAENCPSLAGKPKLFFIQACRGGRKDSGSSIALQQLSHPSGNFISSKIPNQSDFLIAFSTVPGFMSWRNTANGSWFVQALHHCFSHYAKSMELMQIMTKVNSMVAFFESYTGKDDSGFKQIPAVTSRLTAEVYFWNWKLENESNCPVCNSQLLQSRDSVLSNQQTPSTSRSSNLEDTAPAQVQQKPHRSKSIRKWIRQSFRRKSRR